MNFRIFSAARSFGGGERYLSLLVPALRQRGHSVELVLPGNGAPEELRKLTQPAKVGPRAILVFNGIGALYRWSWAIPRGAGAIYIHHSSLSDDQSHWIKAAIRPALLKFLGRKLSAIIRVCKSALPDSAASCPIHTVFNGVDVVESEAICRTSGEKFIIAMLGTLNANKNQAAAIRILASLPEGFVLKLIGSGPAERELRDYASGMNVADRIIWTGFTANPLAELKTCHVALVLSRNEAFPFSALEAMSVRVPVVAYDVGGLPELITDGENGVLVTRGAEEDVRAELLCLGADEQARRRLAENALEVLRLRFSVSAMTDGFEDVVARVVTASPI